MLDRKRIVIVSGLSGSGKSVALKSLEDRGFYAVDNLPATLIPSLVDTLQNTPRTEPGLAISIDIRSAETIAALPHVLEALRRKDFDCRVLFLDASDEAITRRFAETRRPHPLSQRLPGEIARCIAEERRMLEEVANLAHRVDTSIIGASTLRSWVGDWIALDQARLILTFQSFGFKHGIPLDADFVFDVRVLPNPYYDPRLRPLNGTSPAVREFLEADLNVGRMVEDIGGFLHRWLPSFANELRAAVTVAIGCTGGQHRSVYVGQELARHFGSGEQVLVRHRDMT
ncbi:MAG: RNase adapter RapZ [Betaproteobacteria bacterium]|nr:RNase adapter RapZ [Betaproteobacteria bacterium]